MGMFDGIKAKIEESKARREAERQESAFQLEHAEWQEEQSSMETVLNALEKISKGEDIVATSAVLKKGEFSIWSGTATLHEARKTAGQWVGRSSGMSFRVAKGVSYRVGGTRGTYVAGPEVQTILDSGNLLLTNTRLLFTGPNQTKEWAFSKWVGAECNPAQTSYVFHVSNRQKASGVNISDARTGREFNKFLTVAMNLNRKDVKDMLTEYQSEFKEHASEEPQRAIEAPKE